VFFHKVHDPVQSRNRHRVVPAKAGTTSRGKRKQIRVVMAGLDPAIHLFRDAFFEEDGSPGQAR
jgi:hypothetical protein